MTLLGSCCCQPSLRWFRRPGCPISPLPNLLFPLQPNPPAVHPTHVALSWSTQAEERPATQYHFLKRMSLLHYLSLLFCQRFRLYLWRSVLHSLFCSIDLSVLLTVAQCLAYCSFRVSLESGNVSPPTLLFFSIMLTSMFWVFCLSI